MTRFLAGLCALGAFAVLAAPHAPGPAQAAQAGEAGAGERARERVHMPSAKKELETVTIAVLYQEIEKPLALKELDPFYTDLGIQGARLGVEDNDTTGRLVGQDFELREERVPVGGDAVAAFRELAEDGVRHVITVQVPAGRIVEMADLPEAEGVLIYNASARDDRLRNDDCRANVLHTIPSRAMLADALAQYLKKKKWDSWFLVIGNEPADELYADAIRRAAERFKMRIREERKWAYSTADVRRTAEAEIPVFTQGPKHEMLIVADEAGWFGDYLMYRTWDPRPVAGTQGMVPTAWHEMHERWGAVQMQNRFRDTAGRPMTPYDYAAWIAVRAIGEAATRTNSVDLDPLRAYMLGPDFRIAAFKGVGVSFRDWNNQLRMPILLAEPKSVVSVAPFKEFLHPRTEMDTLGYDKPDSTCELE